MILSVIFKMSTVGVELMNSITEVLASRLALNSSIGSLVVMFMRSRARRFKSNKSFSRLVASTFIIPSCGLLVAFG